MLGNSKQQSKKICWRLFGKSFDRSNSIFSIFICWYTKTKKEEILKIIFHQYIIQSFYIARGCKLMIRRFNHNLLHGNSYLAHPTWIGIRNFLETFHIIYIGFSNISMFNSSLRFSNSKLFYRMKRYTFIVYKKYQIKLIIVTSFQVDWCSIYF